MISKGKQLHRAAGGIFYAKDTGKILLGFRSQACDTPNVWAGFGGGIKAGESIERAVHRETEEETGYTGPRRLEHLYTSTNEGMEYHNFLILVPQQFNPKLNWEHSESTWFDPWDLPDNLHPWLKPIAGKILEATRKNWRQQVESSYEIVAAPKLDTLKDCRKTLTPEERDIVLEAGAVWHHGNTGNESPAVWKAVVKGKDWFVCNTHRVYRVSPTLKGAIREYEYVKTTASGVGDKTKANQGGKDWFNEPYDLGFMDARNGGYEARRKVCDEDCECKTCFEDDAKPLLVMTRYEATASRLGRYMDMFKFFYEPESRFKNLLKEGKKEEFEQVKKATESENARRKDVTLQRIKKLRQSFGGDKAREDAMVWGLNKLRDHYRGTESIYDALTKTENLGDKVNVSGKEWEALNIHMDYFRHIFHESKDNNIKKILDYRIPSHAPVAVVFDTLKKQETEWKESIGDDSRLLHKANDPFLKFSDGWQWQVVHEGKCAKEAGAMRHCGNRYAKKGDKLLSLREPIKLKDGKAVWKPHATFILENGGHLGEMKGFGNEKPAASLHKYIIPLLEMDEVEGFGPGGGEPGHNFSLNDLDDKQVDDLLQKKSALAPLFYRYKKEGLTDEMRELIADGLQDTEFLAKGVIDNLDAYIIVESFKDLKTFAEKRDSALAQGLDAFENFHDWYDNSGLSEAAFDFFRSMTKTDEKKAVEAIDKKHQKEIDEYIIEVMGNPPKDVPKLAVRVEAISQLIDEEEKLEEVAIAMSTAMRWSDEHEAQNKVYKDLIGYIENYEFDIHYFMLHRKDGADILDGEVHIIAPIAKVLAATEHGDESLYDIVYSLEPGNKLTYDASYHSGGHDLYVEYFLENF